MCISPRANGIESRRFQSQRKTEGLAAKEVLPCQGVRRPRSSSEVFNAGFRDAKVVRRILPSGLASTMPSLLLCNMYHTQDGLYEPQLNGRPAVTDPTDSGHAIGMRVTESSIVLSWKGDQASLKDVDRSTSAPKLINRRQSRDDAEKWTETVVSELDCQVEAVGLIYPVMVSGAQAVPLICLSKLLFREFEISLCCRDCKRPRRSLRIHQSSDCACVERWYPYKVQLRLTEFKLQGIPTKSSYD